MSRFACCFIVLVSAANAGLLACAAPQSPHPTTTPTVADASARLEVVFSGLESTDGQLVAALWTEAAGFDTSGEPVRSAHLPITGDSVRWSVDVPVGEIAIKAYHDRDGDGALDRGPVGLPTEPYGISNDARGRFGPPSWADARVELGADGASLTITIR